VSAVRPLRLAAKAALIFAAINIAYAGVDPNLGSYSVYNWLIPGRRRLPIQDVPTNQGFAIASENLDALLASHEVAGAIASTSEYRVFLLGDSETYGIASPLRDTLGEQLNRLHLSACGKQLHFYNLAYPFASSLRDFLVLQGSLRFKPDAVVWILQANAFLQRPEALAAVKDNPGPALQVLRQYGLGSYAALVGSEPGFWDRSLWSRRGGIHRWADLQLWGISWAAADYERLGVSTSFDTQTPTSTPPKDVAHSLMWSGYKPETLAQSSLTYDVLIAAHGMTGSLPFLLVTQPIFIASGANTDIRYNSVYPRWAYDGFREAAKAFALEEGWDFLDAYKAVPSGEFIDALHMTGRGEAILAQVLVPHILGVACR
jgi:hypothetical protein